MKQKREAIKIESEWRSGGGEHAEERSAAARRERGQAKRKGRVARGFRLLRWVRVG